MILVIESNFGAQLVYSASLIELREPQSLDFKVCLARMKFFIISQVNDVCPDEFAAAVLKNIYYSFHVYRLFMDAELLRVNESLKTL